MTAADSTILVIDDVEENCELLKRRLEKSGYKVETAMDGQEGLMILARKPIQMVLLDLDMPVMNGFTFLEKIKSNPKYASIPVVVTTCLKDLQTAVDCQIYGACAYLAKPYDMADLLGVVKNTLENQAA